MPSQAQQNLKKRLIKLLQEFDTSRSADLRKQVLSLVQVWGSLSKLGANLVTREIASAARDRILHYFRKYPMTIISHKELMVVSGISEWARRVRELRKEKGWPIISGKAVKDMFAEGELSEEGGLPNVSSMKPNEYLMLSTGQDRDAAFRWQSANEIRRSKKGAKASIIKYLRENVGRPVTGEELRYVANDKTEWARRTRELRTEDGWQICTHRNGRPDLTSGLYVLESERRLPAHDRKISDPVRRAVLVRDNYHCKDCNWHREMWNPDDPRHLELHHLEHHMDGGENVEKNLVTLCNVCHVGRHRD